MTIMFFFRYKADFGGWKTEYSVNQVYTAFEPADFFSDQGAAEPDSLSYQGEYVTQICGKRCLQKENKFCLQSTEAVLRYLIKRDPD